MLNELINKNEPMPDPRAGSTPALAGEQPFIFIFTPGALVKSMLFSRSIRRCLCRSDGKYHYPTHGHRVDFAGELGWTA